MRFAFSLLIAAVLLASTQGPTATITSAMSQVSAPGQRVPTRQLPSTPIEDERDEREEEEDGRDLDDAVPHWLALSIHGASASTDRRSNAQARALAGHGQELERPPKG